MFLAWIFIRGGSSRAGRGARLVTELADLVAAAAIASYISTPEKYPMNTSICHILGNCKRLEILCFYDI